MRRGMCWGWCCSDERALGDMLLWKGCGFWMGVCVLWSLCFVGSFGGYTICSDCFTKAISEVERRALTSAWTVE